LEAGRYGPARLHLERAVALSPGLADGWTNLGSLEAAQENHSARAHVRFGGITQQPGPDDVPRNPRNAR
jgi:hypothetical protein